MSHLLNTKGHLTVEIFFLEDVWRVVLSRNYLKNPITFDKNLSLGGKKVASLVFLLLDFNALVFKYIDMTKDVMWFSCQYCLIWKLTIATQKLVVLT